MAFLATDEFNGGTGDVTDALKPLDDPRDGVGGVRRRVPYTDCQRFPEPFDRGLPDPVEINDSERRRSVRCQDGRGREETGQEENRPVRNHRASPGRCRRVSSAR